MKYISLIFLSIILGLIFSSCSTDVNVNGDWEDYPVVYCVLDHSKEVQYVKINKSFLGPVPASEMAQISDSLFYYDANVVIKELRNGYATGRSWQFEAVDTIQKDDGYFASDKNTIYASKMEMNEGDGYEYELNVDIENGRHLVSGKAYTISDLSISVPNALAPQIELATYDRDFEYRYYNGSNGKIFQMQIVFNYLEVINGDTSDHVLSLKWEQPEEYRTSSAASEVVGKFSMLSFYNTLSTNIAPAEEGVVRLVKMPNCIEFNLTAADENYATYMEVTSPSDGIVQEKPSFTNLTNALGLFAARYTITREKKLGGRTLDSIARGIHTKDLGFAWRYDQYYSSF